MAWALSLKSLLKECFALGEHSAFTAPTNASRTLSITCQGKHIPSPLTIIQMRMLIQNREAHRP
jgi:hypothetical protein